MLIEFSVENYRSIRDKQTLSMLARRSDKALPENCIPVDLPGMPDAALLKSVILYGANASGKSNILDALLYMALFTRVSAKERNAGDSTGVVPFAFRESAKDYPSSFEVKFIQEGVRYTYGFSLDHRQVREEWLYAYPKGSAQKWFERTVDGNGVSTWETTSSGLFRADKQLMEKTRPNALFLSVGQAWNHQQLTWVYEFVAGKMLLLDLRQKSELFMNVTVERVRSSASDMQMILNHLKNADIAIAGIEVDEVEMDDDEYASLCKFLESRGFSEKPEKFNSGEPRFLHAVLGSDATYALPLNAESSGTKRFFALLGVFADVVSGGLVVCMDEIESSLHPALVRYLVKTMHGQDVEAGQFIFTTHDATLLDVELFRRDQIWFTERNMDCATQLYPLSDYSPRKNEALSKGYLAGRYGGVPVITEHLHDTNLVWSNAKKQEFPA